MRRAPTGISFQPFYAEDEETAEALLKQVLSMCAATNFQFYLPSGNAVALALVKKYFNIFEYRPGNTWLGNKAKFEIDVNRVYSILDYCFAIC